jgi:hypothetical protein
LFGAFCFYHISGFKSFGNGSGYVSPFKVSVSSSLALFTNSEGAALGYPLWLTVESEFRTDVRGDYAIPLDDGTPIPTKSAKVKAETAKKETTKKVKTEKPVVPKLKRKIDDSEKVELSDDEFVAELAAAGITL